MQHATHGYTDAKDDYLKRLRRVEGQVRGIARMVDEDVYCIDILTQVAAVTKALQAVSIGLVEDHLAHCVVDAARQSPEEGAAKVKEASDAIARLVRSSSNPGSARRLRLRRRCAPTCPTSIAGPRHPNARRRRIRCRCRAATRRN